MWANIAEPRADPGGEVARGIPTNLSGRVLDTKGQPIEGAVLDVWQTDSEGHYDVQRAGSDAPYARGRFAVDAAGRYGIRTVKPVSYAIPTDGPVGVMLAAMGRDPFRPAHVHMIVSAPGFATVTTHLFVRGDPFLETDAVFAVKPSLIIDFIHHPSGPPPMGGAAPSHSARPCTISGWSANPEDKTGPRTGIFVTRRRSRCRGLSAPATPRQTDRRSVGATTSRVEVSMNPRSVSLSTYPLLSCAALSLLAALSGCGESPDTEVGVSTNALYFGMGHCPPFDDNSACLCEDANLGGYCQVYSSAFGSMVNPTAFAPLRNDSLSSLAVGANVLVEAYPGDQFWYSLKFLDFAPSFAYWGNGRPGTSPDVQSVVANDDMSSFRVMSNLRGGCLPNGVPNPGTVVLFTDANYGGDCVVLTTGEYPNALWAPGANGTRGNFGMHNDWLSSVRVAAGMKLKLWSNGATFQNGKVVFAGPSMTTTDNIPVLDAFGFNDMTSGVEVSLAF
jgi:Dioxygenase